jgi:hypothetical protein
VMQSSPHFACVNDGCCSTCRRQPPFVSMSDSIFANSCFSSLAKLSIFSMQVLFNRICVFAGSGTARVAQATSTCFWECVGGLWWLWQACSQSVLCHQRGVRGRSGDIWVARRDISFFHVAIPAGLLSMGMRSSASVLSLGFAVAMSLSIVDYLRRTSTEC